MNQGDHERTRRRDSRTWVLVGFAAVVGYFVLSEHGDHVLSNLPFILLAACPLLHLLHGHGGHGSRSDATGPAHPLPPADKRFFRDEEG